MRSHIRTVLATAAATAVAVGIGVGPADAGNAFGRQCPKATRGEHGKCVRELARNHKGATTPTTVVTPDPVVTPAP